MTLYWINVKVSECNDNLFLVYWQPLFGLVYLSKRKSAISTTLSVYMHNKFALLLIINSKKKEELFDFLNKYGQNGIKINVGPEVSELVE